MKPQGQKETGKFDIALKLFQLISFKLSPTAPESDYEGVKQSIIDKFNELEKECNYTTDYDIKTHPDFTKYYDKSVKRNIWVLGYYGGGSVPIWSTMALAKQYAQATGAKIERVKIDEVLSSRSVQGYKFMYSTEELPMEKDIKPRNVMDSVKTFLSN
jgi:hypothetical protein